MEYTFVYKMWQVAIALLIVVIVIIWLDRGESFLARGVTPDPIISTYTQYLGAAPIVVGIHKTAWCPACQMATPVWNQLKEELKGQNILFVEFDEDKVHTPWVSAYPTIVRVADSRSSMFQGRASSYRDLKSFILNVNTWSNS